jgi:hypothetical protein
VTRPQDILLAGRQPLAAWLSTVEQVHSRDHSVLLVFTDRVYPTSGTDGQSFELFCGFHCAHCCWRDANGGCR